MEINKVLEIIEIKFKGRAVDELNMCTYNNKHGKRCAIGLFIPDNHEALSYSGGIYSLLDTYPSLIDYMPSKDIDILKEFQKCHDSGINENGLTDDYIRFKDLNVDEQKMALMFEWLTLTDK